MKKMVSLLLDFAEILCTYFKKKFITLKRQRA